MMKESRVVNRAVRKRDQGCFEAQQPKKGEQDDEGGQQKAERLQKNRIDDEGGGDSGRRELCPAVPLRLVHVFVRKVRQAWKAAMTRRQKAIAAGNWPAPGWARVPTLSEREPAR